MKLKNKIYLQDILMLNSFSKKCLATIAIAAILHLFYKFIKRKCTKPIDYSNKHILITGASSGIGECIAKHYYNYGATIYLASNDEINVEIK